MERETARRPAPARSQTTQLVQRRAEPSVRSERGAGRSSIADFSCSLGASEVQLKALDDALVAVQRAVAAGSADSGVTGGIQAAAAQGIQSGGGALPHRERIQAAFGRHDVSTIQAHVGSGAAAACGKMGAEGYATGKHVAFGGAPSLHLAAHEAAHVIQQQSGRVQLSGGVGQAGDRWEQHADKVADKVVRGESAVQLLDSVAGGGGRDGGATGPVQRKEDASGAPFVWDDKGIRAPEAGAPTAATGENKAPANGPAAAQDTKAGVEKSIKYGKMQLTFKAGGTGGEAELKGELKEELYVPIMLGAFFKVSLALNASAKGAVKPDGSFEATMGGELTAQLTANGGVPKVGSVYGGGEVKVPLNAMKVSLPKGGSPVIDDTLVAIKIALVLGAELDLLELIKKSNLPGLNDKIGAKWKLEWKPGGELEVVRVKFRQGNPEWEAGADFEKVKAWISTAVDRVKTAVLGDRPNPDLRLAGKDWADSIVEPVDDKPLPLPGQ